MTKTLLRCHDCNRLLLLGSHNRAPAWRMRAGDMEPVEVPRNDEEEFRRVHARHRLGELAVVDGSFVSEGAWGDPMRVTYFEATDGHETVVVRRHRTQLDRPVIYEVMPGRLEVRAVTVEVQARDIRRQIEADLPGLLDPDVTERFVRAVEDIAGSLEPEELEEICVDARETLVAYARLDEKHVAEILDRIGAGLPPDTLRRLHRFILDNSEGDDVMNLVIRKAFFLRDQENEPFSARA
jgi:hypothetical protein